MSLLALLYWEIAGSEDRVPYLKNREEHPRWPVVHAALGEIADLWRARGVPFFHFTRESSPRLETIAA